MKQDKKLVVKRLASRRFGRLSGIVALLTVLLGSVSVPIASAASASAFSHTVYQQTLQAYANQLHDVGVTGVIMQARPGLLQSVSVRSGEAIRQTGQAVPWTAHFKTGSTTKTFVSTVMLQLEAEGKLSLNDSLQKWLPDVLGPNYDESAITLRNLLGQTSGIFDYTDDEAFLDTILTEQGFLANRFKNYTVSDLVNLAKAHPQLFAPGTSWSYSNTNYVLAGLVIKAVTGNDWSKEVRNRILLPLGMTETTSAGSNAGLPFPFAHAYHIYSTDPAARTYTDTTLHNMSWANAAGDLITTTNDENRFFRALMSGRLLPAAQLSEMKTVTMLDENLGYGLGILWSALPCDARGFWSHAGGVVGYATGNGVTDDGQRSAILSLSTTSFSDDTYLTEVDNISTAMMAYALCGEQSANVLGSSRQSGDGRPATSGVSHVPADAAEQLRKHLLP